MLEKFKHYLTVFKHSKTLKDIQSEEYFLTNITYWHGHPMNLKKALSTNDAENHEDLERVLKAFQRLKENFEMLPLELQLGNIFNINTYCDSCSFVEPYQNSCRASQNVMIDKIIMSYVEIVLPKMNNSEVVSLLEKVEKLMTRSYSLVSDELKNLSKIKLEYCLQSSATNKKTVKI